MPPFPGMKLEYIYLDGNPYPVWIDPTIDAPRLPHAAAEELHAIADELEAFERHMPTWPETEALWKLQTRIEAVATLLEEPLTKLVNAALDSLASGVLCADLDAAVEPFIQPTPPASSS